MHYQKARELPASRFQVTRLQMFFYYIFNILNIRQFPPSCNAKLIAVNASEWACEFRKKDWYVIMFHFDFKIAKKY